MNEQQTEREQEIRDLREELYGLTALKIEIEDQIRAIAAELESDDPNYHRIAEQSVASVRELFLCLTQPENVHTSHDSAAIPPARVPLTPTGTSTSPAKATSPVNSTQDSSSDAKRTQPLAVVRLAKGWEEKLVGAGVLTVGDLEEYIAAGKLVAGALLRIGPEAVEKIKGLLAEYLGGGVAVPVAVPVKAPAAPPQKTAEQIYDEGFQFAKAGFKVTENPYQTGTENWKHWDNGWQDCFATMEASDEATQEPEKAAPPSPGVSSEEFPAVDLSAVDLPEESSELVAASASAGGIDLTDL